MIKNALFLFFICAAVFVFYLPAYLKMQDLSEKNRSYQKKIVDLERENQVLGLERERLKNDPAYFEMMARDRMGIIKQGEVIYKVVPTGSKKPNEAVSEDEASLMKKPEDEKKPLKSVKAAVVKKSAVASGKKSLQQKKKTSAIMSKSKTAKTVIKTSSTDSKKVLQSDTTSSSKD